MGTVSDGFPMTTNSKTPGRKKGDGKKKEAVSHAAERWEIRLTCDLSG
jgi:hypothetical protein